MNPENMPPTLSHDYCQPSKKAIKKTRNVGSANNQRFVNLTTDTSSNGCGGNCCKKINTKVVHKDTINKAKSVCNIPRQFCVDPSSTSNLYYSMSKETYDSNYVGKIKGSESTVTTELQTRSVPRSSVSRDSGISSPHYNIGDNMRFRLPVSPNSNGNSHRFIEKPIEGGLCCVCPNTANFTCKGCRWWHYCSEKCQAAHWPFHQKNCFWKSLDTKKMKP
ncbi:unnamed protein product [Leptidea sinapis]|uniref:MYND-type domain-containing protein n=1 Tax=Leptidea sinapis TaxID=189913 RepID=A0A5E4PZY2_9NEOP|nr:unnamed protein product [Leptidea sinapis]